MGCHFSNTPYVFEKWSKAKMTFFALCRAGRPNAVSAGMRWSGRVEKAHGRAFSTTC